MFYDVFLKDLKQVTRLISLHKQMAGQLIHKNFDDRAEEKMFSNKQAFEDHLC